MPWTSHTERLPHGRRYLLDALSFADALRLWQHDDEFRTFFLALLADAPYAAFRWETPALTLANVGRPFEFVLLDDSSLARAADPAPFAAHFRADADAIAFANLGRDAVLVVPCPAGPHAAYPHLAAFVRRASEAQRHALWRLVGEATERRLDEHPVWLSTAGAGVAWLHVRLDDRPKYYGHAPYRTP